MNLFYQHNISPSAKEIIFDKNDEFIDDLEIERIKERILDHWQLSFDDLEERVEFIAGTEIHCLKEYRISDVRAKINKVSSQSVKKLLAKLIKAEHSMLKFIPID